MKWFKNLFQRTVDPVEADESFFNYDIPSVPEEFREHQKPVMTTTEALEEVLRKLDIIEEKLDKL